MTQKVRRESTAKLLENVSVLKRQEHKLMQREIVMIDEVVHLNAHLAALRSQLVGARELLAEMHERVLTRYTISSEILTLRGKYLSALGLAKSKKITVARREAINAEALQILGKLQHDCTHPFVLSYDGFQGSKLDDWDDRRYGHRVCALCCASEVSLDVDEDRYELLAENNLRIVRRDIRQSQGLPKSSEVEWFTVDFVRELFENSVGSPGRHNLVWPNDYAEFVISKCSR